MKCSAEDSWNAVSVQISHFVSGLFKSWFGIFRFVWRCLSQQAAVKLTFSDSEEEIGRNVSNCVLMDAIVMNSCSLIKKNSELLINAEVKRKLVFGFVTWNICLKLEGEIIFGQISYLYGSKDNASIAKQKQIIHPWNTMKVER